MSGFSSKGSGSGGSSVVGLGGGSVASNLAVGTGALAANTTGYSNVAVGEGAGAALTTGHDNVLLGPVSAASMTTGNQNTFLGSTAAPFAVSASQNVAVGYSALAGISSSVGNVAVGYGALLDVAGGANYNIGIGYNAGSAVAYTGNIAIGYEALYYEQHNSYNVAIGYQAMLVGQNFDRGVAVGYQALTLNTGNQNTAIGYSSLAANTSGGNNFAIGYQSGNDAMISITTASNQGVLGNNTTTNITAKVALTVTSDARDKVVLGDVPLGLDFVYALKPVAYQFKVSRDDATPSGRVRYGFLAQDILPLEGSSPVIIDATDPEHLRYNESDLVAALVNAVQTLSARVFALEAKLAAA